jgi:hypothetical protein
MNVLADNALLSGFAAQQRPVNMELVRDVCVDFDVRTPLVPARAADAMLPRATRPLSTSDQRLLDTAISAPRVDKFAIRKG